MPDWFQYVAKKTGFSEPIRSSNAGFSISFGLFYMLAICIIEADIEVIAIV